MTARKRLTRLTPEQEARLGEWAQRWIAIGLSTDPADRRRAEEGIRRCYRFAGLEPPPVIWVPSPIVGGLAAPTAAILIAASRGKPPVRSAVDSAVSSAVYSAVYSAVDSAVDSAVYSAVSSAVYSAVNSAVYSAVNSAVRSAVDSAVYSAVDSAVYSAVYSAVRSAVDSAVRSAVDSAVYSAVDSAVYSAVNSAVRSAVDSERLFWHYWFGGAHWAAWPAYLSCFRDVAALQLDGDLWNRLAAYEATVDSCGYWWPNRDFVMVGERPSELHRDERGRLHSLSGPAISYAGDGWGIYSVHGVTVPSEVVEKPASLTAERILGEANVEVRRVMIELLGYERFLRQANAHQLSVDEYGTLWRIELRDDEPLVLVEVVNSTPEPDGSFKDYLLRVPPAVESARQAVAWTFGKDEGEYAPAVQT